MERVYALGVSIIELVQEWFQDYEGYFEVINTVSNPNHTLDILFPLLSIVDSVFSAQLVLCMAFGGWLNAVMKWWLLEDRPYWWVRETDFYSGSRRPVIRQNSQTCETGPGCPSGHSQNAAMILVLTVCWISHYMTDRKLQYWTWWKYVWYPLCAVSLGSVMLARMFVGTHFPHQVLAGALLGGFLGPFLCIYVADPFIWQYGRGAGGAWGAGGAGAGGVRRAVLRHCAAALAAVLVGVFTYFSMLWCGFDPQWTIKLAFRWCEDPDYIHVSTTPMYALVYSTGNLLGWAVSVTPEVAKYRHYTKSRSLIIAAFSSCFVMYAFRHLRRNINKDSALHFYLCLFVLCAVRVPLLLRVTPALAMWPYDQATPKKMAKAKQKVH